MRWTGVAVGAMMIAAPAEGHAQVAWGPLFTVGDDSDLGVGARAEFDLAGPMAIDDEYFSRLFGSATGTYSFQNCGRGGDCGMLEIGGNANLPLTGEDASVTGYVGAGIHLVRSFAEVDTRDHLEYSGHQQRSGRVQSRSYRSDTSVGPNFIGGVKFNVLGTTGFLEGKYGFSGAGQFVLSTGLLLWE